MGVRSVGVEEEFLLVDAGGRPQPLGDLVVAQAGRDGAQGIEHELQQEQAETGSRPQADLGALHDDLTARRRELSAAAARRGGSIAALGTSPVHVVPTPTEDERYARMMREYALTAIEQLTCGCHVHVDIRSRAEGVAVLDRIRPWLSVLQALAVNSPFWQGADTGHASYRRMVWDRWPGAGPPEAFGDVATYDAAVSALERTGVLLDAGMVYFDARLSRRYPTVEIRVADVCPEPADAVLVAGLARALVETAAEPGADEAGARVRVDLLRGAAWRAARSGLSGNLVDVLAGREAPAETLLGRLVDHVRPALRRTGDLDAVEASLHRLLRRGTGADLQRAAFARRGSVEDVVTDAVARTVSPAAA